MTDTPPRMDMTLDGYRPSVECPENSMMAQLVDFLRARVHESEAGAAVDGLSSRQHKELQAKRGILSMGEKVLADLQDGQPCEPTPQVVQRCLQHVAAVYETHTDYRLEWTPLT